MARTRSRDSRLSSVPPLPTPLPDSAGGTIDLGAGTDSVTLANSGGSVTISNTETITGGTGADTVTLATALYRRHQPQCRRRQPHPVLHRQQHGHALQCRDGHGRQPDDKITLATAVTAGVVDLGGGADTLKIGNGTNSATISNAETITGGTGADTVTLAAAIVSGIIDLGAGADKLPVRRGSNV